MFIYICIHQQFFSGKRVFLNTFSIFVKLVCHSFDEIIASVSLEKKVAFITQLESYWKLKRHSKSGVPLIRLSHSSTVSHVTAREKSLNSVREFFVVCF